MDRSQPFKILHIHKIISFRQLRNHTFSRNTDFQLELRVVSLVENDVKDHSYSSRRVKLTSEMQNRLLSFSFNRSVKCSWMLSDETLELLVVSELDGINGFLIDLVKYWSFTDLVQHWVVLVVEVGSTALSALDVLIVFHVAYFRIDGGVAALSVVQGFFLRILDFLGFCFPLIEVLTWTVNSILPSLGISITYN